MFHIFILDSILQENEKTISAVLKFDLFDAKHLLVVSQDPIREKRNYKHSKCAYKCLILCAVVRWLASAETIEVLVWMNKYILLALNWQGASDFVHKHNFYALPYFLIVICLYYTVGLAA